MTGRPTDQLLAAAHPSRGAERAWDEPSVDVLLADHDPISSHVLSSLLNQAPMINLRSCVDSLRPPEEWPLTGVQVVVLSVAGEDDTARTLHRLSVRGVHTLLLGIRWTRARLDAALAAGANGVLVKQANTEGLVAGIQAVSAGHQVLSPELFDLWRGTCPGTARPGPGPASGPGQSPAGEPDPGHDAAGLPTDLLTRREREVLDLLARGATTGEAALSLAVSPATIKSHVSHALAKLGVRSRLEAVLLLRGTERVVSAHALR